MGKISNSKITIMSFHIRFAQFCLIPSLLLLVGNRLGMAQEVINTPSWIYAGKFYDAATDLVLSKDNTFFLTSGADGTIKKMEFPSCHLIKSLGTPFTGGGGIKMMQLSSDSKLAVASKFGRTEIWDVESGTQRSFFMTQGYATAIAVSGNSDYICETDLAATTQNIILCKRNGLGYEITKTFDGQATPFLAFSTDSKKLFMPGINGSGINIYDVINNTVQKTLKSADGYIWAGSISLDGKYLFIVDSKFELKKIDWQKDSIVNRYPLHDVPSSIRLSSNGSVITLNHGNIITTLSTENLSLIFESPVEFSKVAAPSYTGDSLLVLALDNIFLYDSPSLSIIKDVFAFRGTSDVQFTGDERFLVAAGYEPNIKIFNAETGKKYGSIYADSISVRKIACSSDGKLVFTTGSQNTVKCFDLSSGSLIQSYYPTVKLKVQHFFTCIAVSPDGKNIVAGAKDSSVYIWDAFSSALIKIETLPSIPQYLQFSADGKYLGIASGTENGEAFIYYTDAWNHYFHFWLSGKAVSIDFSRDNRYVIGSSSNSRTAFLLESQTPLSGFYITGSNNGLLFSPAGNYLFGSCYDSSIRVKDITSLIPGDQKLVYSFTSNTTDFPVFSVSPNAKFLAAGGTDGSVSCWALPAKLQSHVIPVFEDNIDVFPTPANEKFVVRLNPSQNKSAIHLSLLDTRGTEVYAGFFPGSEEAPISISCNNFASGVYTLLIKTEHAFSTKKVIIFH